jgi:lysophospholipase L1-like esterase
MNTKIIKLDINNKMYETITAKQGDTESRFLLFHLFDASLPFDLTEKSVRVYGIKPDGTKIFNDLVINDVKKGYCTLKLTNQMLAIAGLVKLELVIYSGNKKLSSIPFMLNVISSLNSDDAVVSTNEFTSLMNGLAALSEYDIYKSNAKQVPGIKEEVSNLSSQLDSKTSEKSGLSGWLRSFEFDRNKKICFIGDSTTDGPAGAAQYLYECFNKYHLNSGDNLEGVTIVDKGSSGNTCYNFINNKPAEKGIDACISEQADLYVFCYSINDVRLGNTTKEQLKEYITIAVERLLKETNGYILLRIPNSLLADDPTNANYIQPLSNSQLYTDIMWESYMELKHKWERVDVIDMQTLIFGRTVKNKADNPYMGDSLHPNKEGFYRIARCIADYIGITPKLRTDLLEIAKKTNPTSPYLVYPKVLEGVEYELICEGYFVAMGSNYLDFALNPIQAYKIQKGDIIKIGDKLAYDISTSFTASAIGSNTRLSGGITFTGYENNNKGMVRIYRKKHTVVDTHAIVSSLTNNTPLKYFTLPAMRINSIDCRLAKPIASALTFKLKQIYQNTIKEIAVISFTTNNMTANISFDSTNCPNGYYDTNYGYDRGALFYVESGENSYSGEVLMNIKLSS